MSSIVTGISQKRESDRLVICNSHDNLPPLIIDCVYLMYQILLKKLTLSKYCMVLSLFWLSRV